MSCRLQLAAVTRGLAELSHTFQFVCIFEESLSPLHVEDKVIVDWSIFIVPHSKHDLVKVNI